MIDELSLQLEVLFFLHLVEGPVGANCQDVAGFRSAFLFRVDECASSVVLEGSDARTRELLACNC